MSAVLKKIKEDGVPDLYSRWHVAEAQRFLLERNTEYGPLLQTVDCNGVNCEVVPPQAMLWQAVREDGAYASMFRECLDTLCPTMASPLRVGLYADEVTPGNVVSLDNLRKICN